VRWALPTAAALAVVATLMSGCGPECRSRRDCRSGFLCTTDGRCVESGEPRVQWRSPEPGSVVDEIFDAVVEVSFQGSSGELLVDRSVAEPGDACAPLIPQRIVIAGDSDGILVQEIVIPGLRSLGDRFSIVATLRAGGGVHTGIGELRGAPARYGGASFERPERTTIDADAAVMVPVRATLERPANVTLWTEPVDAAGAPGEPSARAIVGQGITQLNDRLAPLARGPQILWLELEGAGEPLRCGRGLSGSGATGTARGLELALAWEGEEAGLLDLRVRLGGEEGGQVCTFAEAAGACGRGYETRGPAPRGEEVLRIAADGIVDVAVVPAAASAAVTARVRVSMNGEHVGWLGPFPIQPSLGQVWIAGRVLVRAGLADLQRIDDVVIGAPF
jgi:hypothetical protein